MIFFTADTHFGHASIIRHGGRPFDDVETMDHALIARWNAVVSNRDEVWHLGDFNVASARSTEWYLERLNGRIHMVWGNHDDRHARKAAHLFASAQDVKYLKHEGERITLYHYAQRTWRNSHRGAWHLFGHSHGCIAGIGRSMDVGVDVNGFRPVSFDEVRRHIADRSLTNHHPEKIEDHAMRVEVLMDVATDGKRLPMATAARKADSQ